MIYSQKFKSMLIATAVLSASTLSGQAYAIDKVCFSGTVKLCFDFGCVEYGTEGQEICFETGGGGGHEGNGGGGGSSGRAGNSGGGKGKGKGKGGQNP